ncbi:MAG: alpha/beta hydrolase family protein [Acidimicrobiia bacterium]
MTDYEFFVDLGDVRVPAIISRGSSSQGICVALHGANEPSTDFFLYEHLADVMPPMGWDVLRFHRRPAVQGVPLEQQVADLLIVIDSARSKLGGDHVSIGLWGFSQGAWTASLAASEVGVAFLVLVGFSAVTPGEQMRYATANYLRSAGHSEQSIAELANLRSAYEAYHRGDVSQPEAQAIVDRSRAQDWFDLAYVPAQLPPLAEIEDPGLFDFNPLPYLVDADTPTLLFYGDDDEDVPFSASVAAVKQADHLRAEVHRLPGARHDLSVGQGDDHPTLHPEYESELTRWITQRQTL